MQRISLKVAVVSVGLAIVTMSTAGAATLGSGTLSMNAGDQETVSCAGPSLTFKQTTTTSGTLACASNPNPTGVASFVQAAAISPGTTATSLKITFSQPVTKGDLLVGWFAQYNSIGPVTVTDSMANMWIRTGYAEKFSNGGGDIALFYTYANVSASNLAITMHSLSATYLPYAVAEYSGIPAGTAPATGGVAEKNTGANSAQIVAGPTANVPAGDLVFGGELCGGQPATFTVGSTQGVPFAERAINSDSGAAGVEDVLSGAAGGQSSNFTISSPTDWYSVVAVFTP
jgi:hypothetical protein